MNYYRFFALVSLSFVFLCGCGDSKPTQPPPNAEQGPHVGMNGKQNPEVGVKGKPGEGRKPGPGPKPPPPPPPPK